jgi:hypothetical protein
LGSLAEQRFPKFVWGLIKRKALQILVKKFQNPENYAPQGRSFMGFSL